MSEKYEASKTDVRFDHEKAQALSALLRATANRLNYVDAVQRSSGRDRAMPDFTGPYADLFLNNVNQAIKDGHRLGDALQDAAEQLENYQYLAAKEQQNRELVRQWEARNPFEQFMDWINGKDAPEINRTGPEVRVDTPGLDNAFSESTALTQSSMAASESTGHMNSAVGNVKVGGSGVSKTSAIPDNLDAYVNIARDLNKALAPDAESLQKYYQSFREGTGWGEYDITGLLKALITWMSQNAQDAGFLSVVSQAFRQAGTAGNMRGSFDSYLLEQVFSETGISVKERTKLDIPPATVTGATLSSGYVNDPVNAATGNFIEAECDLSFPTSAAEVLNLERMYNSLAVKNPDEIPSGIFGPGWSSTLDQKLDLCVEGASWYTSDGRILFFARNGQEYSRVEGEPWWLTKAEPGSELYEWVQANCNKAHLQLDNTHKTETDAPFYWVVANNEHHRVIFTPEGAWVGTMKGHPTNIVVASYDDMGRVADLVHPTAARGIHIMYGEGSEEKKLHDTQGRPKCAYTYSMLGKHTGAPLATADYEYTTDGYLCAVTTMAGTRAYTYTAECLLHEVTNVNGQVEVTNTYDESARVVQQITEYGREVAYTYMSGLMTIVSDAHTGENPNIWINDEKGRLIGLKAADGTRQTMRYDSFGNRVSITQRDGSTIMRSFDSRGRIKRERTPEGADYTYSWDEHDRVTAVSVLDARDPKNLGSSVAVMYEYAADGLDPNPVSVTDGTGAVTRYEWDKQGHLIRTIDPTGVCTRFTYDEHGDLATITNGVGDKHRVERDEMGRITCIIDALGRRGYLSYNSAGAITSIEAADGARWTFAYPEFAVESLPALVRNSTNTSGGCGNLPTSVTDPYGATIRFTYNAGGEIASVTNPLGHTTEGTFDTWGNLVGLTTASGAVWKYVYDGLSQLVEATDPSGAATRYSYDLNGELSSVTDATGVEIKRRVDRQRGIEEIADAFSSSFIHTDIFGRVTSEQKRARGGSSATKTDVESEFITYDAAGRPVEILDAAGGLTRYERDGAGRVLRVISAAGRIETYDYDAAGRVISHAVGLDAPRRYTDEAGVSRVVEPSAWAITRLEYDAASQIIKRINPNGSVEKITYDVCGRVIGVESGARVASYEYDLCGRLVGVRDSSFGQRRFKYDAAGQMVQATDGLGFRTHFSYTATGQVCRVVDATGQVTDYEYDAMDRLVRVIKAAGTDDELVQEYAYDAAGRLVRADDGVREYTHVYDYAAGGRLSHTCVDGVKAAEFGIEDQGRTVWVRDYASAQALDAGAPVGAFVQHRFVYDARGLLVERSRSGVLAGGMEGSADAAGASSGAADVDAQVQALNTFTNTGAYTLTLGYDADGYRTRMVTPYGETAVTYDGAGRMVRVSDAGTCSGASAGVGAELSYDVLGRLTRVQVADVVSSWEFDGESGLACSYTQEELVGDASGYGRQSQVLAQTNVIRDEQGRVVGLDSADGLVVYTYDAAGQLTGSRAGDLEFEWVFEAGLMVSERTWRHSSGTGESEETSRVLSGERSFAYNHLNQLTEIIAADHTTEHTSTTVTTYEYNAAGERTREIITNDRGVQRVREYAWGAYSGLASVTDTYVTAHGGEAASRVRMVTDVTGELAQVAGGNGVSVPLLWDPDAAMPQILGAGSMPAPGSDGGFSQVGIAGGFDPWAVPSILGSAPDVQGMNIPNLPRTSSADGNGVWGSMLPAGFSFTGAGSVRVAGLDVMGARVFDGASKRFLSTDPLAQVPGTGFFADVYAFCGNNPVGLMDPWGLRPVTIEEYDKYLEHQGERTWWKTAFTVVAVAATVGAVIASGPVGIIVFSALAGGAFAASSAVDTVGPDGGIDWGHVGSEAGYGALTGAIFAGFGVAGKAAGSQIFGSKAAQFVSDKASRGWEYVRDGSKVLWNGAPKALDKAAPIFKYSVLNAGTGAINGGASYFIQHPGVVLGQEKFNADEFKGSMAAAATGNTLGGFTGPVSQYFRRPKVAKIGLDGAVGVTYTAVGDSVAGKQSSTGDYAYAAGSNAFMGRVGSHSFNGRQFVPSPPQPVDSFRDMSRNLPKWKPGGDSEQQMREWASISSWRNANLGVLADGVKAHAVDPIVGSVNFDSAPVLDSPAPAPGPSPVEPSSTGADASAQPIDSTYTPSPEKSSSTPNPEPSAATVAPDPRNP